MNPNIEPRNHGPGPIAPNPEQAPIRPTPERANFENLEIDQTQQNPELKDEPQVVQAPANPYSPPPPGQYRPEYQQPVAVPPQTASMPDGTPPPTAPNPSLPVNQEVAKKRAQARKLLIVAVTFALLFVIGIIVVTVLFVNSDSDSNLQTNTTDTQLRDDLNTFALGVANFRNGDDFFTITTEDVGRLRAGYIPTEFNDPRTDVAYVVTSEIPEVGEIQYIPGGVCNQDDSISQSGNDENFATRILLEEQVLHCIERTEIEVPSTQ